MRNIKKISLIFSLVLILIVSLGIVSASDDTLNSISDSDFESVSDYAIDDSDFDSVSASDIFEADLNEDIDEDGIENSEDNGLNNIKEEDKKVSSNPLGQSYFVDNYTFGGIQKVVNSASAGDTIVLSGTYVGNGTQILVSKKLTFKSIGETVLDGKNLSRAFNITGKSVSINNLTFINCLGNTFGGAIYWNGANGVLDNSTFMNNYGTINAGAVNWPGANGTMINCNFVNNSANYSGAVFWGGVNGSVKNCSFIDNSALSYCGAIYFLGNFSSIYNCSFVNNSANSNNGGAVYWSGSYGKLENCSFVNNSAQFGGGILWSGVNGSVVNCSFVDNFVSYYGGAISWSRYANGSVVNCSFLNNVANNTVNGDSRGGAIDWNGVNGSVVNCSFVNNSANDGSTVHWNGVNGSVVNCSFVNSSDSYYGTIWWTGANGYLFNSSFVNSPINNRGGALYWSGVNGSVVNCSFVNNSATNIGGAVYWYGVNGSVVNCSFVNNSATNIGGAVYWYGVNGSVVNCSFVNNSAFYGGAIYSNSSNLNISHSNFTNNTQIEIWNEKILSLENNALSNVIYNNGTIISPAYLRVLGNSTKITSLNSVIDNTLIVDDNNNLIFTNESLNLIVLDNIEVNAIQEELGVWTADYTFDKPGIYLISANNSLSGFENLNVCTGVIIAKYDTNLDVLLKNLDYFPNATIEIILDEDARGNVTISIGDMIKSFELNDDLNTVIEFDISELDPGNYNVTVEYSGDDNYLNNSINKSFTLKKLDFSIFIETMNITFGNNANVKIDLPQDFTGNVTLIINSKQYSLDSSDIISIEGLSMGHYDVVAVYWGDKHFNALLNSSSFEVFPASFATSIDYDDMVTTAVDTDTDGRAGENFTITLKDSTGKALANKKVLFGFNGKIYEKETDSKGKAQLQINLKRADIYTFAVCFLGDDGYKGSFAVAKITVNKQKPSLTVPNKSYKASAKTKTLTATFKSASGKVVANKKVTFTVNGKTYTATTDAKGVATVNVSLNKKGTYNFIAKFAGDNTYAAINKTAKLTIK